YAPLGHNEIRLVQLLPGPDNTSIELQILPNVHLASVPKYLALSYVWGDPTSKHSIRVNGSPVEVTSNLADFLWYQRKLSQDAAGAENLWIDAICINQNNTQERNIQVLLMVHIYQRADRTIVWL
ncbi:HET-domain-containing protein, partial [Cadophora sp. DSE1049]